MSPAYSGGCRCGNITYTLTLSAEPSSYQPRACDCDFCRRHHAAYLSDPKGSLHIALRDEQRVERLRQGTRIAEFLLCADCGDLVAVTYTEGGECYAAINSTTLHGEVGLGAAVVTSPRLSDDAEKIQRWKGIWFAAVEVGRPGY